MQAGVCVLAVLAALKGDADVHYSGQDFTAAGLNGIARQTHLLQGGQATQLINTHSCNLIGGQVQHLELCQ